MIHELQIIIKGDTTTKGRHTNNKKGDREEEKKHTPTKGDSEGDRKEKFNNNT